MQILGDGKMKIFAIFAKLSLRAGDEVDSIDRREIRRREGIDRQTNQNAKLAENMRPKGKMREAVDDIDLK